MHTHAHTYIPHAHMHAHIHANSTHTHSQHKHTHKLTHIHTHTYTHTHNTHTHTHAEVQKENKDLRAAIGGGEVADRIMFLERALAEERLLSSDLRKKLKTKRESLHGRLSVVASEVCG